ncbi:MAG: tetratricopeptide repeat protein [Bacteroidota bacterium]
MIRKTLYILFVLALPLISLGQEERKENRKALKNYNEGMYDEAILDLQKALKENPESMELYNNLGHAEYRNESYENAAKNYMKPAESGAISSADQFYNLGNAMLQSGEYDKSIQAYKQALKTDPGHFNSKYNMSLARAIKKRMEQQQQQQQKDQQDKDDKDKDKEDQKDQQQKDKEEKQEDDQQQQEQQEQQQKQELSKEDAERILRALQEKDKELQEKKKKEQKAQQQQPDKDW